MISFLTSDFFPRSVDKRVLNSFTISVDAFSVFLDPTITHKDLLPIYCFVQRLFRMMIWWYHFIFMFKFAIRSIVIFGIKDFCCYMCCWFIWFLKKLMVFVFPCAHRGKCLLEHCYLPSHGYVSFGIILCLNCAHCGKCLWMNCTLYRHMIMYQLALFCVFIVLTVENV